MGSVTEGVIRLERKAALGSLYSQRKDVLTCHDLHSRAQANFSPDIGASVQHLTLGGINLQEKEGKKKST